MNQTNLFPETGRNSSFKIGDKTNDPYLSPTPGHFPIVAWAPVPMDFQILLDCDDNDLCQNPPGYNGSEEYDALLREIALSLKESGFNAIVMMGSYKGCEGIMEAALDTTDENGKDCDIASIFVTLPRYCNSFAAMNAMIEHFSDKKTKKGKPYPSAFLIQNQPQFNDWSQSVFGLQYIGTKNHVNDYAWNSFTIPCIYFKQWRERWLFFTNLAGSADKYDNISGTWHVDSIESELYRSQFSANATNQEQYLQALQLLFHPGLWCYDQFPFVIEGEKDCEKARLTFNDTTVAQNITDSEYNLSCLTKKTQEFYHFLECFNKQSKETNRPFWSFIGVCAAGDWNGEKYYSFLPTPTIGMLRFEAFNAIALGAQGLVCWQYGMGLSRQFLDENEETTVFVDAPMQATVPINPVPGETEVSLHYRDNQLWQDVKTVMNEVKSLEKVFLNTDVIAFGHCFPLDNVHEDFFGLKTVSFASGTPAGFTPIKKVIFFDVDSNYEIPGVLISILKTEIPASAELSSEPVNNSISPLVAESPLPALPVPDPPVLSNYTDYYIVITNHDAFNSQERIQITFNPGYRIETIFGRDIPAISYPPVIPSEPIALSDNTTSQSDNSDDVSSGETMAFPLSPGSMHIYKFTKL